jgi:phosphoribosylformimino-5-aminoimidazole carboxamide ribonucleotide (ProFAR) isomerase
VRGGEVVTHGWLQGTDVQARVAFDALRERGVRNFVFTNVDRDGMLEGPDLEEVRGVAQAVKGSLIYSGGIGQLVDLEGLAGLAEASLEGVIVGKALYERRFTVAQAQAALGS